MNDRQKGIAAVLLAALLWSTAGLFIKLLPQNAFTILCYRALYTMAVFFALFRMRVFQFNGRMWVISLFYAGLLLTFVTATKLTTAANAIFLQYTGAAYILLLEPLLFKMPYRKLDIITTVVCFAGMSLFLMDGLQADNSTGILLGALSGVMLAGIFLGQRANPPQYHVAAIFWGNVWVALIGFPSFWASAPATVEQHLMLAFLGIIQMGLAYAIFTYGLQRTTAMEASLLSMMEPLFNPLWVMLGYGETPSWQAMLGGVIIIAALAVRLVLLKVKARGAGALG